MTANFIRRIIPLMHRGRWRLFVFLSCALAVVVPKSALSAVLPAPEDIVAVVPGAVSFEHQVRPLDYYLVKDAKGQAMGAVFVTTSVAPQVTGYRDEIDVLVGINLEGEITEVKVVGHRETPEFMQRVLDSGFLNRFVGRIAGDDFADIEAVTGATVTSQAIAHDIRTAQIAVAEHLNQLRGPVQGPVLGLRPWAGAAAVLALVVLAATASFFPRRRYLRTIALVLSVPVVGLWLNTPVTIGDLVDLRNLGLPGLARLPLIILLVFALAASLFRGNLYCTYLCPFGALQRGAAALKLPKCSPDQRVERSAAWLRWIITPIVVYAIAGLGSEAFRTVEPFALCFSPAAGTYVWIQTGAVLLAALFVRRIWCRFFCPTGLFLDVLALVGGKLKHGIISLIRRRRAAGPTA